MKPQIQISKLISESKATLRKRNQITLPAEVIDLLGVREGDTLVISLEEGCATLRPVRHSYAGIAKGVYGDAGNYVARERAAWE